jgi:predicted glutamine amidotransferase
MCRVFGLSAAPRAVRATFWLLDSSDSLSVQSHREPDGVGVGIFTPDGEPEVFKQPVAAYRDREFAREARDLTSRTFIAHVRFASTGGLLPENTHPFCQHGRLFAHNGLIEDLPALERELGVAMSLVRGDTDSERLFALITKYAAGSGDVGSAITAAVGWVADNLPLYAVNLVLTTDRALGVALSGHPRALRLAAGQRWPGR